MHTELSVHSNKKSFSLDHHVIIYRVTESQSVLEIANGLFVIYQTSTRPIDLCMLNHAYPSFNVYISSFRSFELQLSLIYTLLAVPVSINSCVCTVKNGSLL